MEERVPGKGRVASPLAADVLERALGEVLTEAAANRLSPSPLVGGKVSGQERSLRGRSQLKCPAGGLRTSLASDGGSGAPEARLHTQADGVAA